MAGASNDPRTNIKNENSCDVIDFGISNSEFYFKTIPAKMSSTLSILLVCPWSGWVPFVREYLSMVADHA